MYEDEDLCGLAQTNRRAVMAKETDTEGLRDVVQAIIEDRKGEELISPAWIATEAMAKLDARELQQSRPLVYLAAHLQLRQIARHACRKAFEAEEEDGLDRHSRKCFQACNRAIRRRTPTKKSRATSCATRCARRTWRSMSDGCARRARRSSAGPTHLKRGGPAGLWQRLCRRPRASRPLRCADGSRLRLAFNCF
jgi:hypothetical protein